MLPGTPTSPGTRVQEIKLHTVDNDLRRFIFRVCPLMQRDRLPHRRWPRGMPSLKACCLTAPIVLFIAFATLSTGVFALECLRSSACRAFVHEARLVVFFFVFLAM